LFRLGWRKQIIACRDDQGGSGDRPHGAGTENRIDHGVHGDDDFDTCIRLVEGFDRLAGILACQGLTRVASNLKLLWVNWVTYVNPFSMGVFLGLIANQAREIQSIITPDKSDIMIVTLHACKSSEALDCF